MANEKTIEEWKATAIALEDRAQVIRDEIAGWRKTLSVWQILATEARQFLVSPFGQGQPETAEEAGAFLDGRTLAAGRIVEAERLKVLWAGEPGMPPGALSLLTAKLSAVERELARAKDMADPNREARNKRFAQERSARLYAGEEPSNG